jgi:uroporphyrin-III C-methyltransferase
MKIQWKSKYILIAGDQYYPEMEEVVNQLDGHLVLVCREISSPLLQKYQQGAIGYLERQLDAEQCSQFHWVILFGSDTWTKPLYDYCQHKRIFVSVFGNAELSDIDIGITRDDETLCNQSIDSADLGRVLEIEKESLNPFRGTGSPNSVVHMLEDSDSVQEKSQPSQEIAECVAVGDSKRQATLFLVGVGPGAPDLLTIRAHNLIHSKSVLISDRLISPELFHSVPSSTKILFTRKQCGKAKEAQQEIHDWILEHLSRGIDVVRVKGGDPFVFGRGGEEWNIVKQHGFQVEWVPGISSCISAPGSFGIPVTHRGVADSFVVCTGQKEDGSWSGVPPYAENRTLVLLMAMGVLNRLQKQLQTHHGYPSGIPVAVVYRATYPDQTVIYGTLETISELVSQKGIKNHSTVIVGNVVTCLI